MASVTDLQQAMLASKYFCCGQFPLQMELNKHTWRLSICKETHVKSMDGTTQEAALHVSTLTFNHTCDKAMSLGLP
jgi:hypothetical protein